MVDAVSVRRVVVDIHILSFFLCLKQNAEIAAVCFVSIRVAAGKSVIIIELFLPPERCDIREHALQRFKLFRCKEQADAGIG